MTEREALETVLLHAGTDGVRAVVAYFELRVDDLRTRLESCSTEALPKLQGQLREAREFLRNFIPVGDSPRTGGYT